MNLLSLYVLTYNTPKQFAYWCEAFLAAYPAVFRDCQKYVINNSDDGSTFAVYQSLFEQYGFEELKTYANTGICGGRFLAAQHFDQSQAEYMVFFEDDMLMRKYHRKLCKSGFKTFHAHLFDDCLKIMMSENLSFLKLCFTEVINTNTENKAIATLTEDEKTKLLVENGNDRTISRSIISKLGTVNGLSYAIGDFYYCNWPILFTKWANKSVFIDKIFKYKYESDWTREACLLTINGKIKTGCLLASPILHHRKYSYRPQDRIENEYGQKIRGVKICREKN